MIAVLVSENVDCCHRDYPEIDNAINAYDNARQLEKQAAYKVTHPWGREALGDDLEGQAFGRYAGDKTLGLIGEGALDCLEVPLRRYLIPMRFLLCKVVLKILQVSLRF
ncbi:hypothetical protein [Arachidicoccus soli]|uniref:Uncharacterized protein n=1 Tax=Arachidicoccus soli TaxID=2341117 RepID=A0A386HNW4_9BACT|nr:hypothetical protein [Arachidicoccus soli]AYD47607.1 hypothetical protein D6B99_08305 [Arachidicoccus soli]